MMTSIALPAGFQSIPLPTLAPLEAALPRQMVPEEFRQYSVFLGNLRYGTHPRVVLAALHAMCNNVAIGVDDLQVHYFPGTNPPRPRGSATLWVSSVEIQRRLVAFTQRMLFTESHLIVADSQRGMEEFLSRVAAGGASSFFPRRAVVIEVSRQQQVQHQQARPPAVMPRPAVPPQQPSPQPPQPQQQIIYYVVQQQQPQQTLQVLPQQQHQQQQPV
eukprot:PhM_4_TR3083/c1_g1_i1/m.53977